MSFDVELKKVSSLIMKREMSVARSICDKLLEENLEPEDKVQVLRKRATLFGCEHNYDLALKDCTEVINTSSPLPGDYYLSSIYSIKLGEYQGALGYAEAGFLAAKATGDTGYINELQFLKSFALFKLGYYQKAEEVLTGLNEELQMWIENSTRPLKVRELLALIKLSRQS